MNTRIIELRRERADVQREMVAIDKVAEGRALTDEERAKWDAAKNKRALIDAQIARVEDIGDVSDEQPEQRSQAAKGSPNGAPNLNLKTKPGDSEERALAYYIRTADAGALRESRASNNTGMNIGTAADGGNAVPTGHYGQIIARRDEMMLARKLGVRNIAGVGTTVNVPIDDEADGEFVTKAEMGDDNTTNVFDRDAPALGTVAMTLAKKTKKIELTDELLADEDSNLLAFIEQFIGRGMAKTHNDLLVTEAAANGTAALTFDSASTIGAAEVPELWYLLPDFYATDEASVGWITRRTTEGTIRSLAGTTNFYYAPTPAGQIGMTPILWGAPLYNSGKVAAIAASAKSVFLGNWQYMGLREGPGLTILRDPYTVDGKVILKYHFRVVYKVLQSAAIIYATHPTA